jgi:hypothetical protein
MQNERYCWSVCFDDKRHGDWENIGTHETRREAEAELRRVRSAIPAAFLVRLTLTRMDRVRSTPAVTVA